MPMKVGDHVQWAYRGGTRAGFVREVYTHAEELPDVWGAKGLKKGKVKISESNPAYLIEQEKDSEKIIKPHNTLTIVGGETGLSEQQIKEKDKEIKAKKTRGKRKAAEVEPAGNVEKKTAMTTRRTRREAPATE